MPFHAQLDRRSGPLAAVALAVCSLALSGCGATGGAQSTSTAVTLKSLTVSPATSSVTLGNTQQFAVTGHFSDNTERDLTQTAVWTCVQPAIASISSPGMAVAKQTGTATITAASGTVSVSATLTVSAPALVSLSLSPSAASIAKGQTQLFAATGTFSNQSTQDVTGKVAWKTSAGNVASINSQGLATAQAVGTATITVTSDSISESGTLTVTPPVLQSIAITPVDSLIGLGSNEQLIATGTFTDGSTQDISNAVTWKSGKAAVASIAAGGLASSWSIGTAKIFASTDAFSVSGTIVVSPVAGAEYFSNAHNANAPDGTLNLVNTGLTSSDLCAMVYVFDTSQEMNECCGCLISQDGGMKTLSVNNDLTSNTLTGVKLTTGVIRVVPADAASNPTCNAGTVTPSGLVMPWLTHIQYFEPGTFTVTETDPQLRPLNTTELSDLASDCSFMQKLGSGHGICTCGVGD